MKLLRNISERAKDRGLNFILIVLTICLILAVVYPMFTGKKQSCIPFDKIKNIPILSVEEKEIFLDEMLDSNEHFILFFELSSCPPCIYRGFDELQGLKSSGKNVSAVTVHNWVDEWIHWAKNIDFDPIYLVNKTNLEKNVFIPYLPMLIRLKNGKVSDCKYITF